MSDDATQCPADIKQLLSGCWKRHTIWLGGFLVLFVLIVTTVTQLGIQSAVQASEVAQRQAQEQETRLRAVEQQQAANGARLLNIETMTKEIRDQLRKPIH